MEAKTMTLVERGHEFIRAFNGTDGFDDPAELVADLVALLEEAERALDALLSVTAEPANMTPEIAVDKELLPQFLDRCEAETNEAVRLARSVRDKIKGWAS